MKLRFNKNLCRTKTKIFPLLHQIHVLGRLGQAAENWARRPWRCQSSHSCHRPDITSKRVSNRPQRADRLLGWHGAGQNRSYGYEWWASSRGRQLRFVRHQRTGRFGGSTLLDELAGEVSPKRQQAYWPRRTPPQEALVHEDVTGRRHEPFAWYVPQKLEIREEGGGGGGCSFKNLCQPVGKVQYRMSLIKLCKHLSYLKASRDRHLAWQEQ